MCLKVSLCVDNEVLLSSAVTKNQLLIKIVCFYKTFRNMVTELLIQKNISGGF